MAAVNITNTLKDPSGTAVSGATITAKLMPCGGFRSDNSEVTPIETTTSDGSGNWTLSLERNDQITPANTYYEITEDMGSTQGIRQWAISVTAAATLQASLIAPPGTQPTILYAVGSLDPALYGATVTNTQVGGSSVVGTNLTLSRSDHAHALRLPGYSRSGMSASIGSSGSYVAFTGMATGSLDFDHGTHTVPGTNDRVTLLETGVYIASFGLQWDANATGNVRGLWINMNGTIGPKQEQAASSPGRYMTLTSPPLLMTAGQYLGPGIVHDSGGTRSLTAGRFAIQKVAAAY